MDEIIYGGEVIGVRRYDLSQSKWILKLNGKGLSLIQNRIEKGWVKVDKVAAEKIKEGANVLIPGIIDLDPKIKEGDYIAVLDENNKIIAGGIARIDGIKVKKMKKGVFAKNYCTVKEAFHPVIKKISWMEISRLNEKSIHELENKALKFIREVVNKYKFPVIVSFSGGKDSLVTLALVKKALPEQSFKVLFVNTGLEFPETIEYVRKCIKHFNLEKDFIYEEVKEEKFWEAFKKYGPPGRDYRYCCKISKLAPIRKALSKISNNSKILSFVGQRRYESFVRTQGEIWQNQYIPNQINASPIQDWNALTIWLYIYLYGLPYNQLYEEGYDRIGCWLCPSSDMAHFEIIKKTHPEHYKKLMLSLEQWAKEKKLPSAYLKFGLWRFHFIPKKIKNILPEEVTRLKNDFVIDISITTSPCRSIPPIIIGKFQFNISIENLEKALGLIGKSKYLKQHKFIHLEHKGITTFIYEDQRFKIVINEKKISRSTLEDYLRLLFGTISRSHNCVSCALCVYECPVNAIKITNGTISINRDCIHCYNCFKVCPVVNIVQKSQIESLVKKIINRIVLLT